MTWKSRTIILLLALLAALASLVILVASHTSDITPRGQATVEDLERALRELKGDASKTRQEVEEMIQALCDNYPELALKAKEICDADTGN